jgi:dipeptidyl aminopeptidase/acylaminoacyl peptidase
MTTYNRPTAFIVSLLIVFATNSALSQSFTLPDIKGYPFPNELTASGKGAQIAWAFNEQGKRNVYVAAGPAFEPRKITGYTIDDGQEITSLSVSDDGSWVVFVRGGDHGGNWDDDVAVNVGSSPVPPKVQVWAVPFVGGNTSLIGEGDLPVLSPKSDKIAFTRNGQAWVSPIDGSSPARNLFMTKGSVGSIEWSPDGTKIAFVAARGDHNLVGIFSLNDSGLTWIAPSFARDRSPKWSPDGTKLVFVRTAGSGGAPDSLLARRTTKWSIWTAEVASGNAKELWKSPETLAGSIPTTDGGVNLHWATNERITFLSYQDQWPHLYSIPSSGGVPLLLTPGAFMVEHIRLTPDRKWLVFSANTGPDKADIDRRHIARVPVDKATMEILTPGTGMEWTPAVTGDGETIAMISTTATRPPLPAVMPFRKSKPSLLAQNLIPPSFPQAKLVTPRQVIFTAPDGVTLHGQLFEPAGGKQKKPAIVYVHGGPPRQMLLGWNYSDYYANAYAYNQYLASLGFVVLSVNYRLGIGYGYEFHQTNKGGSAGASEYQDVKAAGSWLAAQRFVDQNKIGIYGGSYGGYLTAMALGRDSKLFAAGVDIHGVHDRTAPSRNTVAERYEKAPDATLAAKVAWESSPVADVATWKSPVLLIHGDDDRNVPFSQSTDLAKRLEANGVTFETLVIVDDTHHWMKHSNAVKVGEATAEFLQRKLAQ